MSSAKIVEALRECNAVKLPKDIYLIDKTELTNKLNNLLGKEPLRGYERYENLKRYYKFK